MEYGLGCIESKLDGTEHIFKEVDMDLPKRCSYVGVMPPVLNQGKTTKCVCYSLTAYLDWRKNQFEGDNNGGQYSIDALYDIRANKKAPGMSIKEALKYLRHTGLNGTKINEYAMVKSVKAMKEALVLNGPCAGGLPVYSSEEEFWKNGSNFYGGHCILFVGYNEDGFIIRNSWGRAYANQGYVLMPYEDFDKGVFEAWTII